MGDGTVENYLINNNRQSLRLEDYDYSTPGVYFVTICVNKHLCLFGDVSLSKIMQWFKTMTTNEYIRNVKQNGWLPFHKRLWQRNYYDRIVRDEDELNSILEYILYNPLKWVLDRNHPQNWSINDR